MECPISVNCIQESWTHEGIEMSQFSLPNYTMQFKNRRLRCGINIILRLLLWYFYYGDGKSNRGTVIVVKRFFSLAKTIVVDVFVIYIPRIPLWYFLLWERVK